MSEVMNLARNELHEKVILGKFEKSITVIYYPSYILQMFILSYIYETLFRESLQYLRLLSSNSILQ